MRRSPHDREILRLAVPAFGALAAEPLYVLADTAIVGHLGTRPLGGLAIAGIVLTAAFGICNFLAYSTTAAVARRVGAGDQRGAAEQGVDGLWLASGLGVVLLLAGAVLAPAVVHLMGSSTGVTPYATTYLRISALGAPAALVALAGTGYLRGLQDTRTTLVIAVGANVANLLLELLLVYGLDLGIAGSAWGTVAAQWGAALAYLALVGRTARAAGARTRPHAAGIRAAAVVGSQLAVRTTSLLAVLIAGTAVAARIGDRALAAHQIAFQLWMFLAFALDAIAIAGQAMTGRFLGADDPDGARTAARRMIEWGVGCGIVLGVAVAALAPSLVTVFTDDADVRRLALSVLWIVAVLQPMNAVVFVLDGILIGAGDARYLAAAMTAATFGVVAPLLVLVVALHGGLLALWSTLCAFTLARLAGNVGRFTRRSWLVTGASRPL